MSMNELFFRTHKGQQEQPKLKIFVRIDVRNSKFESAPESSAEGGKTRGPAQTPIPYRKKVNNKEKEDEGS